MCVTVSRQRSRIRAAYGNDSCNEPRAIGLLRLLSDENFDNHIVRALVRRLPTIDLIRVQDVGLGQTDDRAILQNTAGVPGGAPLPPPLVLGAAAFAGLNDHGCR